MTLHRNETGEVTFECDGCGEELETLCRDFPSALAEMRESEWRAKKVADGWAHLCYGCRTEDNEGPGDFEDVS